ncbi:MAG: hypothetical protein WCT14_15445 [Treponemataceae bacterium]
MTQEAFSFSGPFRGVLYAAGLWWAVMGLVFFMDFTVRSVQARRAGGFPTKGTFAACRQPLYAWFIFFAFPSAALIMDNALFFISFVFSILFSERFLAPEEAKRSARFGSAYAAYAERTNLVVPIPRRTSPLPLAVARLAFFGILGAILTALTFFSLIQPMMCMFGATKIERETVWPGDEWAGEKAGGFTQAVTINAPPEKVWPWLVQVGYRRAGWYNIDQINALAAADYFIDGKGSSMRIVSELQKLAVGDKIFLVPGLGFDVAEIEPNKTLLLLGGDAATVATVNSGAPMPAGYAAVSWLFSLSDLGGGRTRVVSRFRSRNASAGFVGDVVWSLVGTLGGATLQQPAMFYGLKARAEGTFGN